MISLLDMGIFIVDEPIDGSLQVGLHIFLLFVPKLKYKIGACIVLLDI